MGNHREKGVCRFKGLQKFTHWLFETTPYYADHGAITFFTQTLSERSKHVRWRLALQEFNVTFFLNQDSITRPPTVLLVWHIKRMDVDHIGRTKVD